MNQQTIATEDMFLLVFCLIDDLYKELVPDTVKDRPGSDRITFNDSEVITLSILQEAHANDSETSFHRLVEKDYRHLFPDLIERSRYHRRRKALLQVQLHLLRHLMNRLKRLAAAFDQTHVRRPSPFRASCKGLIRVVLCVKGMC